METGPSQEQSEAHLEILEEVLEEDVATKDDLRNLETRIMARFEQLELKMTVKLGVVVTIGMGAIATFVKILG